MKRWRQRVGFALLLSAAAWGEELPDPLREGRFEIQDQPSTHWIVENYEGYKAALTMASEQLTQRTCRLRAGRSIACFAPPEIDLGQSELDQRRFLYLPPIPPPNDAADLDASDRNLQPVLLWVPIDQRRGGQEWAQNLAQRRGQVENCEAQVCSVVVATHPVPGLARCELRSFAPGPHGPLEWCQQLVVAHDGRLWAEALVGYTELRLPQLAQGRVDFHLEVIGLKQKTVAALVAKALAEPPLNLEVERVKQRTVWGIADYRTSAVLKGWRETVTIRVDLLPSERDGVGMSISSTLYLNRQNTPRPSD